MALEPTRQREGSNREGGQLITRTELNERIREWGIREDVIEKDYVIGWALWGIGSDPLLSDSWAFKGGTCLKKCYVETYRFSEDLDFTVLHGGPAEAGQVIPVLKDALERVYEQSGIDFQGRDPIVRVRPDGQSAEGRVYYRGPRNAPGVASLRLDLTTAEQVVRPTVLRPISHPYPDALPAPARVRCYSFEETYAEKLRAMGERARPRDLYDIIALYRRLDVLPEAAVLWSVYREKCETKGVEVFTSQAIQESPFLRELQDEWANMLAHQLPALPPFSTLWDELPLLYAWLEGSALREELPLIPATEETDDSWSPPSTLSVWGQRAPIEKVRFAAANRLCVEIGYQDGNHLVEPYSLRMTNSGQLTLYAVESDTGKVCSYSIDQIQSVSVRTASFAPRFKSEVAAR